MTATATVAAAASPAAPVSQPDVVFVRLNVDLWPDYDRRGVLVIVRGDLAPGVELPTTVRWSMPAAAGPPTAVAEQEADGGLVNLEFERSVVEETATIETRATRPTLQFEYYDPGLSREGATRSFSYRWPGDFEVGELTVSVQQPDLASELSTDPPAATRVPGFGGLLYHVVDLGAPAYGEPATVDFSFVKEDDRLTVETVERPVAPPVEQPGAAPAGESSPGSRRELLIVVLALAAVVFIGGAGLVFLRRRTDGGSDPGTAEEGGYCTQCGAKSAPSDRFCHRCGQPLRSAGEAR